MARQNDHNRVEELISAYLDKRVSTEEKDFFERHIASCAACRTQLETTRSLVAALKVMPAVKAPRSFVLPREMARQSAAQPKRSFLAWYPALRLATVVAALAFAVLFASDLLIIRSGGGAAPQFLPAAAPAPAAMQAPEAARQAAPTEVPAPAETANDAATLSATEPAAPPAAGAAAKSAVTETTAITESASVSMVTATPEATATAGVLRQAQMTVETTPESAVAMSDQQAASAAANLTETPSTIDPLRVIEIALLALAIVLGIATFVIRRKQA